MFVEWNRKWGQVGQPQPDLFPSPSTNQPAKKQTTIDKSKK